MKFYNVKDVDGFFDVVDKCKGKVLLVTSEGDCLNLKSTLCKYVSFAKLVAAGGEIPEMEIMANEKEDIERLIDFMAQG